MEIHRRAAERVVGRPLNDEEEAALAEHHRVMSAHAEKVLAVARRVEAGDETPHAVMFAQEHARTGSTMTASGTFIP